MKKNAVWIAAAVAVALVRPQAVKADAVITDFNGFTSDALYAGWADLGATVTSGPNSYDINAVGYGSNYKYIGFPVINGLGNVNLELTVALSGPPAADGQLGPIVTLIDGDGTRNNYAWYGQPLGAQVLTKGIASPTWVDAPGSTPGLDLATLTHMHMQIDPGAFGTSGAYTIQWQNLSLTVPEPGSMALAAAGCGLLALRRRK